MKSGGTTGFCRARNRWWRTPALATVVMALIAAVSSVNLAEARQQPTGFEELAVGEWLGNGRAGGVSSTASDGLAISMNSDFTANMEFVVDIDGSLSGTWILDGTSVAAFSSAQITFQDSMTHSASGPMAGNSREFSFGTAQINSTHNVVGDITYGGTSSDPVGPIGLQVEGIYCNDAWGAWIMSWNLELQSENYTPTFDGDWYAIRQSAEFSEREGELSTQISQLYADLRAEFLDLIETQPVTAEGVVVLPADVMWEYIYRLVDLHNALRNLTPCDRALIGDDQVEAWIYRITESLASFIVNLLAQYDLGADDLAELVNMASATGAIGEGSLDPIAEGLEQALNDALTEVVNDSSATIGEQVSAAATRWQHGWPIR